jgi:hypothetical protein
MKKQTSFFYFEIMSANNIRFCILKSVCICCILLLNFISVNAGDVINSGRYKVVAGPHMEMKGDEIKNIFLYSKDGYYVISKRSEGIEYYFAKFNGNMELTGQKQIDLAKSAKGMSDPEIMSFFEISNKIYVLTKEKDGKQKKINYFVEELNLNTLLSQGEKKKIFEIDYSTDGKRKDSNVFYQQSKDKKTLIIYVDHLPFKGENIAVSAKALDETFSTIWQKDIDIPIAEKTDNYRMSSSIVGSVGDVVPPLEKSCIDSSGNLYLLSKVYHSSKTVDFENGKLNYEYHVYMLGKEIPSYSDVAFGLKDKPIREVVINSNGKGELFAYATFSQKQANRDGDKDKGLLLTIIDFGNKKIEAQNYNFFTKEALSGNQDKNYFAPYIFRNIMFGNDGSFSIVAEEYNLRQWGETTSSGFGYTKKECYGDKIMILKVNSSAVVERVTVIPKRVHMIMSTGFCSFLMLNDDKDNYDFFYYDLNENISSASGNIKMLDNELKNSSYVHVKVNPDGTCTKKEVVNKVSPEDNVVFNLDRCGILNEHEALFINPARKMEDSGNFKIIMNEK